jgi:hypothetical protein
VSAGGTVFLPNATYTYIGRAGRIGIDRLFQIFGFNSLADVERKEVDGLFGVMS